ncbi:MAG: hypothetical protein CSA20_03730 [Deltaproteobacteria bacterium]|nr:MAG: hypothetical protein CSA20_03730 [Deltaproteobacteria bacterium]
MYQISLAILHNYNKKSRQQSKQNKRVIELFQVRIASKGAELKDRERTKTEQLQWCEIQN